MEAPAQRVDLTVPVSVANGIAVDGWPGGYEDPNLEEVGARLGSCERTGSGPCLGWVLLGARRVPAGLDGARGEPGRPCVPGPVR